MLVPTSIVCFDLMRLLRPILHVRRRPESAAFFAFVMGVYGGTPEMARGVQITSDVIYATTATMAHSGGGTRDLTLDVYAPDTLGIRRPALLLVHGGSFTGGDKTSPELVSAGNYFANLGWVCFSINYRLAGDDPPAPWWIELLNDPVLNAVHAAATDTKRAVRWIRDQESTYGIDPLRVAAIGHSAGAYCVLMSAITDEEDFANDAGTEIPDFLPAESGQVNVCLEVSGDDGVQAEDYDGDDPPLMIWHGDVDTVVAYSNAQAVAQECLDHQIPHRFMTAAGKEHGAATWSALIDGKTILEHAEDFFSRFFFAQLGLIRETADLTLTWPSVSNAVYDIESTKALGAQAFAPQYPGFTATGEVSRLELLSPSAPLSLYRLRIRSGQ